MRGSGTAAAEDRRREHSIRLTIGGAKRGGSTRRRTRTIYRRTAFVCQCARCLRNAVGTYLWIDARQQIEGIVFYHEVEVPSAGGQGRP